MTRVAHRSTLLLACGFWLAFCVIPVFAQGPETLAPLRDQESYSAPDAPSALATSAPDQPTGPAHAFWDKTNRRLFMGVGLMRALDYASTRNMIARGREEILLPDDVVNNQAGFIALEAAATATSMGLSYVLHRTHHHSLERWLSIGHISVAGFGAVRNYCLESKHPSPPPPGPASLRQRSP
jgi:hypothetical protein